MNTLVRYIIIFCFFGMLGFTYSFHLPKLKKWILINIQLLSYEKLPLMIKADDVEISLLPIELKFTDIKLSPQKELKSQLAPIYIKEFSIALNPVYLLVGKAHISYLRVQKPQITYVNRYAKDTSPADEIKLEDLKIDWAKLMKLPLDKVIIEELEWNARFSNLGISNQIKDLSFKVEKSIDSFLLQLKTPSVKIKDRNLKNSLTEFSFSTNVLIEKNVISINHFKVSKKDSFVNVFGKLNGQLHDPKTWKANVNGEIKAKLSDLRQWYIGYTRDYDFPKFYGSLKSELNYNTTSKDSLNGIVNFESLQMNKIKIGNLFSKFTLKKDEVFFDKLRLKRKLNHIIADKTIIKKHILVNKTQSEKWVLSSDAQIKSFELNQLLNDLDIGDTPLVLNVEAKPKCDGEIFPDLKLTCVANLKAKHFEVWSNKPEDNIVNFDNLEMDGEVFINKIGVYPKASLKLGKSIGSASATIEYAKGFDVNYQAEFFQFSDLNNLVGLDFKGTAVLKGRTYGDSQHGIIDMDLKASDFWLDNFGLGNPNLKLFYKDGILDFSKINSNTNKGRYKGQVKLDLRNSNISGSIYSHSLDIAVIQEYLDKHYPLPFQTKGRSRIKLKFDGPLQFNKLNYDLKAQLGSFFINQETLEKADIHITARKGNIRAQNFRFQKGNGTGIITGSISSENQMNLKIETKNFELANFNYSRSIDSNLQGLLNANFELTNQLSDPDIKCNGTLTNFNMGSSSLKDSNFQININKKFIKTKAELFDNAIYINAKLPIADDEEFYLKGGIKDWNFAPLFSLLAINVDKEGYETLIDTKFNLESPKGGIWNANGNLVVNKFKINRDSLNMEAKDKLQFNFKNGIFRSNEWVLSGTNTFLKFQTKPSRKDYLDLSLNGKANLALLSFLTPFFADLRGEISLSGQIAGSIEKPELVGSAFVRKGLIRLHSFPHAFENLKSDLLFSQQKIIINSINSTFAQGSLKGNGSIQIMGFNNIPSNFNFFVKDAQMKIPEGFNYTADGNLNFRGNWFPFDLTGNVNIKDANISLDQKSVTKKVQPSKHLPSLIIDRNFEPIRMNLRTNIDPLAKVSNEIIDSNLKGNLLIKGTISQPEITGKVNLIKGGKVFFRDSPFEISVGTVNFDTPKEINPQIYLSADTDFLDQLTQDNYVIDLLIQGRMNNFTTKLSSQPILSETDIISLLALGVTSQRLEEQGIDSSFEQQFDQKMIELGATVITNSELNKKLKDNWGLNLQISTDVDDNNTTQPKIVVSKQFTPKLGISGGRTLGNSVKNDMKLEYKLKNNLSTILSWENNQFSEDATGTTTTDQNNNIFGLDLRYKLEFK